MPGKRSGRKGNRRGGGRGSHNGRGGRGGEALRGGRTGSSRPKIRRRYFGVQRITGVPDDVPMLMDLSEPKPNTFAYYGRRQVQSDVQLKGSLRNRPMEFVKAKEVYDPNRELFHKLATPEELEIEVMDINNLSIAPTPEEPTPQELSEDNDIPKPIDVIVVDDDDEEEDDNEAEDEVVELEELEDDIEKEIMEEEEAMMEIEKIEDEIDEEMLQREEQKDEEEDEQDDDNDEEEEEEQEVEVEAEEGDEEDDEEAEDEDEEEEEDNDDDDDDDELDILIDDEPDTGIRSALPKKFASATKFGPNIDYNPTLTIGKVQLNTAFDDDGNCYVDTRQLQRAQRSRGMKLDKLDFERMAQTQYKFETSSSDDDDNESIERFAEEIIVQGEPRLQTKTTRASTTPSKTSEAIPEYGFLPEDFDFDVGRVSIDNVRFGISNLYHVRNPDLCGDDSTYAWVEEEELYEYLVANGVKPHRLDAFMKYVCGDLLSQEYEEQPNYSDVYILETLEDDDDDDDDGDRGRYDGFEFDIEDGFDGDGDSNDEEQEGENVDMLMALAKTKLFRDQDFVPIEGSSRTRGSGRKKHLDLDDYDMDVELMEDLQEQYRARREGKKRRKAQKIADAILNHDMLIKYPLSMHIKEIKSEFEELLRDDERETMLFPPLDPHGNKTIVKMAVLYNMKSLRCGKPHQFVKVSKCKTTYTNYPSYDIIKRVLKQRPRFPRRDVSEPRAPGKKGKGKGEAAGPGPHLREGDIVGEKAPEIGQENIGRRLLEKLGWKYGEGLGMNNHGINEPVVARVKKSKLGLKTQ